MLINNKDKKLGRAASSRMQIVTPSLKRQSSWGLVKDTLCNKLKVEQIISTDLLQEYLNEGWEAITDNYKGKKGKEIINTDEIKGQYFDKLTSLQKKLALEVLGSIRKYLVEAMFKCTGKTGKNYYIAVGSNNITSDYDVSIIGPDSNDIMWEMFNGFLKRYGNSLPSAFDSNLYSSPLYAHKTKKGEDLEVKGKDKIPRVDYGKEGIEFTLVPKSKEDVMIELRWASIKLLKLELKNEFPYLKKLTDLGEKFKKEMDKKCEDVESENALKELLDKYKDPETRKIIKNYYLQYNAQKICSDYIYNETSELKTPIEIDGEIQKNIFFYSNVANYFSSEAYYTSSAVNSIVVENQIKTELDKEDRPEYVIKGIYLTAAIENFGDMINHMEHEHGDVKKTIIKYSKYLYRIYFVLGKIDKKYKQKANQLKNEVIPYRATYDIEKADKNGIWDYVYYNNESKGEYINKIKEKIGGKLEGVLRGMKEIHEELEKDNNGNPIKEDKKIEMNDKELEFPIKNEELDKSLINDQPMGPVIMNKIGSGGKKKRSKKKRYRKKRKTIKKKRRRKKKRSIKFKNY